MPMDLINLVGRTWKTNEPKMGKPQVKRRSWDLDSKRTKKGRSLGSTTDQGLRSSSKAQDTKGIPEAWGKSSGGLAPGSQDP